ncbi:MAG: YceI family protein [SAR324 cluster bacterium]|nr:YceI family protein [SAR324 cluster bacterium]
MLQNLRTLLSTLLFVYFLGLGAQHLEAEEIFQQGEHCLAYKTEETILLFVDSDVVGKTCEISARLESEGENTRYVVSFPIRSLDSGVDMRDEDVIEILSVESHPIIRFVSDFVTGEQVVEALVQGTTTLSGVLEVGGNPYKILFPLKLSEHSGVWLVTGKLVTSFSDFGLELPAVLGGVVADTRDYLELLVHLRLDQIHGLAEFQAKSMSQ